MARSLTKKQKGFAQDYLHTGNASFAAKQNYDVSNDLTARVIGSENLTKPNIRAYLEDKAQKAAETIFDIVLGGENDTVKLNASKDILDRAGYNKVDKTINVNVEVAPNPKVKALADKLNK